MINLFAAVFCAFGAIVAASHGQLFIGFLDLLLLGVNLYFYVSKLESKNE